MDINLSWIIVRSIVKLPFSSGTEREGEGRLEETFNRGEESSVSRQFSPDIQRDGSADRRMERCHWNVHVVSKLRHMVISVLQGIRYVSHTSMWLNSRRWVTASLTQSLFPFSLSTSAWNILARKTIGAVRPYEEARHESDRGMGPLPKVN